MRPQVARLLRLIGRPCGPGDLDAIMRELDADGGGKVDFSEFTAYWSTQDVTALASTVGRWSETTAINSFSCASMCIQ